jgi:hypothetical protein
MSIENDLEIAKKIITELIESILQIKAIIPGTYKEVYRKCGKSYCWCAQKEKGHPYKRITWSENGKTRTKAIPDEDLAWIKEMTANYKIFRLNRQKLRKYEQRIHKLLDKYEEKIIDETRKTRGY